MFAFHLWVYISLCCKVRCCMLTSIATTNCLATDFCPALTVSDKTLSAAQTVCGLQEALHLQHCARFEEFNRFEFLKFGGGGLCASRHLSGRISVQKCSWTVLCGLHVALLAMAAPLCRTVGPCQWVVRLPAEKQRQGHVSETSRPAVGSTQPRTQWAMGLCSQG